MSYCDNIKQSYKDYLALRDSPVVLFPREGQENLPYREAPLTEFSEQPIRLPTECIRAEHSHLKALIGCVFEDRSPSIDDNINHPSNLGKYYTLPA